MTTHIPMQQFYKTTFITEALKSDYFLRSVLSVSAFHLAQQHQELLVTTDEHQKPTLFSKIEGYLIAANVHYNVALSSFRQRLANTTAEDSHALFGCAALIAMTSVIQSCDRLRQFSLTTDQESSQTIMEWLVLLRGVKSVLTETREWVNAGPMAPMLYMRGTEGYDNDIAKVDEHVTVYLDELSVAFVESAEPKVAHICVYAIELLRKSFAGMASGCDPSVVFLWPVRLHEDFMELLKSNRPEALIVLGFYCVLLHTQDSRWWIQGWPQNILKTVDKMVGEEWRTWLRLPWEILNSRDSGQ